MEKIVKEAVKSYQCAGCVNGPALSCYSKACEGIGCSKHAAGTYITGQGSVFIGLPKGFNRLGNRSVANSPCQIVIYEKFADYGNYDKWNVPVWKHLTKKGHTLVRFLTPRLNEAHIHIFLENCMDKINCFEVSREMSEAMD